MSFTKWNSRVTCNKSYYKGILSESNNSKKMWDNVNLIINKKTLSSSISEVKIDSKHYTQPTSIATNINNYFCNIARDLAAKLPHKGNTFKSYLPRKTSKFKLSKVSELEVFLLLEGMDKTKSLGLDKIHSFYFSHSQQKFISLWHLLLTCF